jgi:putative SOS response-associated peptidase YedK
MCGRYRLSRRKQIIAEHFDATTFDDDCGRYNVAPTQSVQLCGTTGPPRVLPSHARSDTSRGV